MSATYGLPNSSPALNGMGILPISPDAVAMMPRKLQQREHGATRATSAGRP
jgi:hypothetical protein